MLVACERQGRQEGAKSGAPLSAPTYQPSSDATLHTTSGSVTVAGVMPGDGAVLSGEALYQKNCSACHQITGQGVPGAFPPLDGSSYVTGANVERMASIMLYGLKGPITVKGNTFNSVMAPLGPQLKDEELAAIATYVRGAWTNKSGPVEAAVFAAMRSKWGTRAQFEISELGSEP